MVTVNYWLTIASVVVEYLQVQAVLTSSVSWVYCVRMARKKVL